MELKLKPSHTGLLVLGDIHSSKSEFEQAIKFATDNSLFVISLGDLVDRGPAPELVVSIILELSKSGDTGLCVGNHDWKHYRFLTGSITEIGHSHKETHEQCVNFEKFKAEYIELIELGTSGFLHSYGNNAFAHASVDFRYLNEHINKRARESMIYGHSAGGGLKDSDGYPLLSQNWGFNVPEGKTAFVGHTHHPFGEAMMQPLIVENYCKGRVFFMDTGMSKGGTLTGAILDITGNFISFKQFKA